MKNVIKLLSISLLISGVMFTSCKKDVTGVSLSETSMTIDVGDSKTLTATVVPADAADKSVVWESNNNSVAEVDANGKVTGKAKGTATITVRTNDGNFTATCEVTVEPYIENNYNVKVVATSTMQGGSIDVTKGGTEAYDKTITISNGNFRASIENISGKIIPQGTPIKYKFTVNGKTVDIEQMKESAIIYEGTLTSDIPVGGTCTLPPVLQDGDGKFKINPQLFPLGNQEVCIELLQIGKKESTPKKDCVDFTIK